MTPTLFRRTAFADIAPQKSTKPQLASMTDEALLDVLVESREALACQSEGKNEGRIIAALRNASNSDGRQGVLG